MKTDLFWAVWPSNVATVDQMARVLKLQPRVLSRHVETTNRRAVIGSVTSKVVLRPGVSEWPDSVTEECKRAGRAAGVPERERKVLPVELMVTVWPTNIATFTQVRRFLDDHRREYLEDAVWRAGGEFLDDRIKLPGEKSRSRLVILRGEMPPPSDNLSFKRPGVYIGDPDGFARAVKYRDQLRQCAKLAAQAGEMLTGEPGNYYPTNGIA